MAQTPDLRSYYNRNGDEWACLDYAGAFADMAYSTYITKYAAVNGGQTDATVVAYVSDLTICMFNYIKYLWRKDKKHEVPDGDVRKANSYLAKMESISPSFTKFFEKLYIAYDDDDAYAELKDYKAEHVASTIEAYTPKPRVPQSKLYYGPDDYSGQPFGGKPYSVKKYTSVQGSDTSEFDDMLADPDSDFD